jgi:hypothetical protein
LLPDLSSAGDSKKLLDTLLTKYNQKTAENLVKGLDCVEKLAIAGKIHPEDAIDCIEGSSDNMGSGLF